MDIARPRWADDPSMILDLVAAGLAARASQSTGARMQRLAAERDAAIEAAAKRMSWWRGTKLKLLARWVELLMPLREAPKHYGLHGLACLGQAIMEVGRRLTARGALDSADDVFFLELSELADALGGRMADLAGVVAARKREHATFEANPPPVMVRSDGVPVVDPDLRHSDPHLLSGAPASSGRVCGPARILTGPDASAIRPGDVIVMRLADPGWTPLFPLAAGVVMEVGGVMCHAAVVARELGVPAVFGVDGVLERLADGQLIEIDGDAGSVRMVQA